MAAETRDVLLSVTLALNAFCTALAFDPRSSQDFCVADLASKARINGLPCKDPATVTVNDFFFSGLHLPGNTSNPMGSTLNPVNVIRVPGLNTLGLTLARLDFAPDGFIPPHYHQRATEALVVLEGSMEVGFVTSSPGNIHFAKTLNKGDVFVVPVGLTHYQRSLGNSATVALAVLNSQNPGISVHTNGLFRAKPEINSDYLAAAFQLDKKTIQYLQARF